MLTKKKKRQERNIICFVSQIVIEVYVEHKYHWHDFVFSCLLFLQCYINLKSVCQFVSLSLFMQKEEYQHTAYATNAYVTIGPLANQVLQGTVLNQILNYIIWPAYFWSLVLLCHFLFNTSVEKFWNSMQACTVSLSSKAVSM